MKFYLRKIFFLFLAVFMLVGVPSSFAQTQPQWILVPCGRSSVGPGMCTLCHLFTGIQNILVFAFSILIVTALVIIFIAGIIYVISAGSEKMITMAKSLFKNGLAGFAIVLLAWLVVQTTMVVLSHRPNLGIEQAQNWWTFQCVLTRPASSSSSPATGSPSSSSSFQGSGATGSY
jgi:hypothetical protein